MKIIEPSYEILRLDDLKLVELAGRTCYKSEAAITDESADKFVRNLLKSGHETPLEQGFMTVKFVVDRGISHEIVRHRLASMNQESTRYCNYSSGKFRNELTFIRPSFYKCAPDLMNHWEQSMAEAEQAYMEAIRLGATPEQARTLLPNSLKTEIIFTANFREWRHFFKTRACDLTGKAHPQMKQVTQPLLLEVTEMVPAMFEDLWMTVTPAKLSLW